MRLLQSSSSSRSTVLLVLVSYYHATLLIMTPRSLFTSAFHPHPHVLLPPTHRKHPVLYGNIESKALTKLTTSSIATNPPTPIASTIRLFGRRGKGNDGKIEKKPDKSNLPEKICVVCGRPFAWRKKWERCWEEVTCCSKKCNAERRRSGGAGAGDDTDL
mmetsp:Transcript_13112/g.26813  ORF Transcript_13112/g.26813 Transcript_13112/m.26813 type:complete len:160 (-) Transcript_13112:100-579(-)